MENGGNAKVNAIFEANLANPSLKPTAGASGPVRERFIRDKYERRKYYDPSVMQDYTDLDESTGGNTASTPSRRAPSDAARLRAQARRSTGPRIKMPQPSAAAPPPAPAQAPPPPPPPPAPEVDLLDFNSSPTDLSAPPNPPSAGPSPTLEMFKTMSFTGAAPSGLVNATNNAGGASRPQTASTSMSLGSTRMNLAPQMEGKMSSDDILAMFHTPSPAPQPQQQPSFGNFSNTGMNGMANNGMQGMPGGNMQMNNMMMNQQQQMQQQMMRNNMMNNNMMMNNNNPMMNNNMMGMGMGTGVNQNNNMMNLNTTNMMQQQNSFGGGMQQQNSFGGMSQNSMNRNTMNMNAFGANQNNHGMMQQQQQQPMGGMPSNMNMMGGSGMSQGFQANSSMGGSPMNHQNSNQSFQSGMGGSSNGNSGFDSSSVMGGSAGNSQQHQFASFGSFR